MIHAFMETFFSVFNHFCLFYRGFKFYVHDREYPILTSRSRCQYSTNYAGITLYCVISSRSVRPSVCPSISHASKITRMTNRLFYHRMRDRMIPSNAEFTHNSVPENCNHWRLSITFSGRNCTCHQNCLFYPHSHRLSSS